MATIAPERVLTALPRKNVAIASVGSVDGMGWSAAAASLPRIGGSATVQTWRNYEDQHHRKPIQKLAQGPSTCPCHALYYKKSEERGRTLADEKDRHPPCNKINIKSRLQTVTARCMVSSFCGRLVMQPQIFGCANQKTGTRRKKEKKKKCLQCATLVHAPYNT